MGDTVRERQGGRTLEEARYSCSSPEFGRANRENPVPGLVVEPVLLQLQRRYGNRYMQRLVADSIQRRLQIVQRQAGSTVTCSVDVIKAAAVLAGDRSAALQVVNCCESGFSPLPSGCTKDLIDAAHKLLGGQKGTSGTGTPMCPPGQVISPFGCCPPGQTWDGTQCSAPSGNFPPLCPPGQMWDGTQCLAPGSGIPVQSPPEEQPGDYNVPDGNAAVV